MRVETALRASVLALLPTLLPLSGAASAQSASQIAQPSYAPPVERRDDRVVLPEPAGQVVPPGADDLQVTLAGVDVEGIALDEAQRARLDTRLLGGPVAVGEVYRAASELEAQLARNGHPFTRIIVPAQQIADGGRVRLVGIAGYIERVDTSALPLQVRSRVSRLLAPLQGQADPTIGEVQRRLLLAGDTAGLRLRSTLATGDKPGGTVLLVDGEYRPVEAYVSAGNDLSANLGREALAVGVSGNSLLGLGEQLYLRAGGDPDFAGDGNYFGSSPRNRTLAAGFVMPIGTDGLTTTVEGLDARTSPKRAAGVPGVTSHFKRLSLRMAWPLMRSRTQNIYLGGAFDVQDERVSIFDPVTLPLSLDRLRIFRANASYDTLTAGGGSFSAQATASFGVHGLGARSAADANVLLPLSRAGADAGFRKFEIALDAVAPVTRHLDLAASAAAQTSFGDPLLNSEQIGISGNGRLSALPAGTLQGDAGYFARAEARFPFTSTSAAGSSGLAPYIFGALGAVRLEQPTVFERAHTDARSYGIGMRGWWSAANGRPAFSGALEYGRGTADDRPGDDRLTFSLFLKIL